MDKHPHAWLSKVMYCSKQQSTVQQIQKLHWKPKQKCVAHLKLTRCIQEEQTYILQRTTCIWQPSNNNFSHKACTKSILNYSSMYIFYMLHCWLVSIHPWQALIIGTIRRYCQSAHLIRGGWMLMKTLLYRTKKKTLFPHTDICSSRCPPLSSPRLANHPQGNGQLSGIYSVFNWIW